MACFSHYLMFSRFSRNSFYSTATTSSAPRITPGASERRGGAASKQQVAGVPFGCALSGALWLPGAPRRELPARPGWTPALTLSSCATWAFCRYMEYSTAVTIELVPSRMTWPSEGRDPLSMATPSRTGCLENACDPYAAAQPFPETVGPSPVDDVHTGSGGRGWGKGDRKTLPRWLRPYCGFMGNRWDPWRTLTVPRAGCGHVGALPPGF